MSFSAKFRLCLALSLLLGLPPRPLYAQRWRTTSETRETRPLTLHASLLMQGIYPGLRVGLEQPLSHTDYERTAGKLVQRERAVLYYTGFYHHPGFHLNVFGGAEYVFRRVGPHGLVTEFRPSLALSRTFLGATTYAVDDAGAVRTVPLAGQLYAMPGLGFGVGKDFSVANPQRPLALMLTLNLTGLLPYNGLVLPTPTLELGCRYRFANLPQMSFTNRRKQRS